MTVPPICYCGSECEYTDSADYYGGKSYGMRWICKRWPQCNGSVGAHPDGRPLGTVPDEETKKLRSQLHAIIDAHWLGLRGGEKKRARGSVYRWLMALTGLPVEKCHVGMFDAAQCRRTLVLVRKYPYAQRYEFYDVKINAIGQKEVVWKQKP